MTSSKPLACPVVVPETTASTMSAIVSVMTVAPTAVATARFVARPMLRIAAYDTSVCDAKSEPSRIEALSWYPSAEPLMSPNVIGIANVISANAIAWLR